MRFRGSSRFGGGLSRQALVKVGAGFVVVILVITGVFSYRSCLPVFVLEDGRAFAATLEPSSDDPTGVALDSSFILTLGEPVPAAAVKAALSILPEMGFSLRQTDQEGKVFRITPDTPLAPNQVYRFVLALAGPDEPGYSWAYQTRGEFRVVGTIPGNRSAWVPLATGIEIEFSHPGVSDPSSYFTISPPVAGRWERHRRTMVFVPSAPLQPATIYTCTVKSGLGLEGSGEALAGDYVFSFETEPLGGSAGESLYFEIYSEAGEFPPGRSPYFPVSYGRYYGEVETLPAVNTQVYRYGDAAAYAGALSERDRLPRWASLAWRKYQPPVEGLERVLQADLQMRALGWEKYIVLPEPLPPGYYVVFFRVEGATRYAWFQVTDLSSYTIASTSDTVMWFNSLASGQPVSGVQCRPAAGGNSLATSGADGLVRFKTPESIVAAPASYEDWTVFYIIAGAPDGSEAVLGLAPGWGLHELERRRLTEAYWSYLFTDRPLYLPSDEVHYWGVIQPLEARGRELARITVSLRSYYGYFWDGPFGARSGSDVISSEEVSVRAHTFHGSVALPNLRPGYYRLEVSSGEAVLAAQSFEVATYTKPAYRIELSANKRAVFAGEPVEFTLAANFFEGTPVSELKFDRHLSSYVSSSSGTLTTGIDGRAVYRHLPSGGDDPFRVNRWDSLSVNANLPESGPVWASAGVRVFEKDVFIRAEAVREGGMARIDASVNRVTLDRINAADTVYGWASEDYTGEPVAGGRVSGKLYSIRYEARETGEYYDFIEKLVRKTYSYHEVRDLLQEFSMITGTAGEASWTFAPEADKTYLVHLSTTDRAGRPVAAQVFVYGSSYTGPDEDWHWYHLTPSDRPGSIYSAGETVDLVVRDRDRDVGPRARGFLFFTARQGLGKVEVSDEGRFSFTFEEAFIPNTSAGGVYFDGRSYNTLGEMPIRFNYDQRALNVSVTTDRESYRPGDRVVIGVECRDAAGRPVAAEVNLCMVDEALFQLRGQSVDLLGGIYGKHIWSGVFQTKGSHPKRSMDSAGGAEQGGEGGGERRDFRDTALFQSISTGADGRATTEVVLPDNLTSWRLTYQAFGSGVRAGSGTKAIPVRLPFFVELAMNETYLAGDRPVVQARAYGEALASGAAVRFSVRLARLDETAAAGATGAGGSSVPPKETVAEFEVTGTAFRPSALPLGELSKGRYELTVTARTEAGAGAGAGGELRDILTRGFDVVDTYLRLDRVDYYEFTGGLGVRGEPGELATLTFCDGERGRLLAMLRRLSGGGRRVDMKVASVVAGRLLEDYFPSADGPLPRNGAPEPDLSSFQKPEGGVSLLPYADPNLELTAKVAALGDVGFDRVGLRAYLGRVYDDAGETRERFIVSLYGLAALGDPVLIDARRLAGETDLSPKEKLYLSLALIELGDEETARSIYGGVRERHIDRIGPLARLKVSVDQEEIIAATSLAAVIESRLRLSTRAALFEYLLDNVPLEELNLLEAALYLQSALPAARPGAVAFVLGPEGRKVVLEPGETFTLIKRSEDLAALSFTAVQGSVGLSVSYRAPLDLSATRVGRGEASLTRTYLVGGRQTQTLKAGDLVKVVVNYRIAASAPEGPYQLVDFLPSGLKIVPRPYEFGVQDANLNYPAEVDGQKITFNIYPSRARDPKTGQLLTSESSGRVSYYARVVSIGTYQADPAVLQHVKSGEIFAATPRETVDIR
jgi:hypothetical protein